MVYKNIEFHNVEELESKPGLPGLFLQRFPKNLRLSMGSAYGETGRLTSQTSAGCEIRFCTSAPFVRISISAWEADANVIIYIGDFVHSVHKIKKGVIETIHIDYPEKMRAVSKDVLKGKCFSVNVWRICFGADACCSFNGIDSCGHSIRPPEADEIPSVKAVCYGSSITMGTNCDKYLNTFVSRIGRILGCDMYNKGISGACLLEPDICDYIADSFNWDYAVLELGINMLMRFSPSEFEKRVLYLLQKISSKNKPVLVTGIFSNFTAYSKQIPLREKTAAFNKAVEASADKFKDKKIFYISGGDALPDFSALCCDLIHPSEDGHILIAEKMSEKIKSFL